jgi:hypothetical protein
MCIVIKRLAERLVSILRIEGDIPCKMIGYLLLLADGSHEYAEVYMPFTS